MLNPLEQYDPISQPAPGPRVPEQTDLTMPQYQDGSVPQISNDPAQLAQLGLEPAQNDPNHLAQLGLEPMDSAAYEQLQGKRTDAFADNIGTTPLEYLGHPINTFKKNHADLYEKYGFLGGIQQLFKQDRKDAERYIGDIEFKAASDTVKGVASLPGDISDKMGLTDDLGNTIRQSIPGPRRQMTDTQQLFATLLQYGIPAGAAYKLTLNVLPEAKGLIGMFGRGAAGSGAAAVSDAAVTNPDETKTLGDALHMGPTQTNDLGPIGKRVATGAESLVAAPIADIAGIPSAAAGSFIRSRTNDGLEKRIGAWMAGTPEHKAQAIGNIDQTLADKTAGKFSPGYEPTTGAAANTTHLLSIERGAAQDSTGGRDVMTSRNNDNKLSIAQDLRGNIEKPEGDSAALRTYMVGENQKPITDATSTLTEAEKAALDADNKDVDGMLTDALLNKGRGEADASKNIDATVRKVWTDKAAERRKAYEGIDTDNSHETDFEGLNNTIDTMYKKADPSDVVPKQLDAIPEVKALKDRIDSIHAYDEQQGRISSGQALGEGEKELDKPPPITFREVNNKRAAIQEAVRNTVGVPTGVRERLKLLRDHINDLPEWMGKNGSPEVQDAYNNAAKINKEYQGMFKNGAGEDFTTSQPAHPSTTAGFYIRPGEQGTQEDVAQFAKTLNGQNSDDVRKLMLNRLVSGSDVTPATIDKHLTAYRSVYDNKDLGMGGLRDELTQLRDNMAAGKATKTPLQQDLSAAGRNLADIKAQQAAEPSAKFIRANAENAVRQLMEGPDPKNAAESLRLMAEDGGPDMVKNLQKATGEYLLRKVNTNDRSALGHTPFENEYAVKLAAMKDILEKRPELKEALEHIYGKGSPEMDALQRVWNSLDASNRINAPQITANSSTSELLADVNTMRALLTSTYGIIRGHAIATVSHLGEKMLHLDPNPKLMKIVARAMVDPEYAKMIMLKGTAKNQAAFKTFLLNNAAEIFGGPNDNNDENGGQDQPNAPKGGIGDDTIPTDIRLGNDNPGEDMEAKLNDAQGNSIPDKSKAAVNVDPYIRPEVLGSFTDKANMGLIKGIRSVLGKDASPQAVQAAYEKVMQHREEVKKGSLANKMANGLGLSLDRTSGNDSVQGKTKADVQTINPKTGFLEYRGPYSGMGDTPPIKGDRYPTSDDFTIQNSGNNVGYGEPLDYNLKTGRAKTTDTYLGNIDRAFDKMFGGAKMNFDKDAVEQLGRAKLALKSNPIAALGFEPDKTVFSNEKSIRSGDSPLTVAGISGKEGSWVSGNNPSTIVHESIHRGLQKLRDAGMFPDMLSNANDEHIVRYLMDSKYQGVERGRGDISDSQIHDALWEHDQGNAHIPSKNGMFNDAQITALEKAAQLLIAKNKPRGPR